MNNAFSFPLLATGSALPRRVWSNEELIAAKGLDSTHDWIEGRTGICQRYLAGEGESTFTLARDAARQALGRAGVAPADVDILVVATCTPDLTFPSVAALVHGDLGFGPQCAALDVNAACSGFIYALSVARGMLMSLPHARRAVVVGAECFSSVLDWNDRGTCVLFGDGAGAVVLGKEPFNGKGLLGVSLGAAGKEASLLQSTGGVARTGRAGYVQMNGREVYKHAVRQMGEVPPLLGELGVGLGEVDWLIPHQANLRIIEAAAKNLGMAMDKVMVTVDRHANTSAASIPLALDSGVREEKIGSGNLLLLQAFGAGFAWGTALIRL